MGDERDRRDCCEKECFDRCRDKCCEKCCCDDGGGLNILWILIIIFLLCSCNNGKGGFLGGLF